MKNMILETNIEIVHRLYQTGKGSFKEMLFQLMALYEAVYTPVRIVVFGAPQIMKNTVNVSVRFVMLLLSDLEIRLLQ